MHVLEEFRQVPVDFLRRLFGDDFDPTQYRMLIVGFAMIVMMNWKPRGLIAFRTPTIFLVEPKAVHRVDLDPVGFHLPVAPAGNDIAGEDRALIVHIDVVVVGVDVDVSAGAEVLLTFRLRLRCQRCGLRQQ